MLGESFINTYSTNRRKKHTVDVTFDFNFYLPGRCTTKCRAFRSRILRDVYALHQLGSRICRRQSRFYMWWRPSRGRPTFAPRDLNDTGRPHAVFRMENKTMKNLLLVGDAWSLRFFGQIKSYRRSIVSNTDAWPLTNAQPGPSA